MFLPFFFLPEKNHDTVSRFFSEIKQNKTLQCSLTLHRAVESACLTESISSQQQVNKSDFLGFVFQKLYVKYFNKVNYSSSSPFKSQLQLLCNTSVLIRVASYPNDLNIRKRQCGGGSNQANPHSCGILNWPSLIHYI